MQYPSYFENQGIRLPNLCQVRAVCEETHIIGKGDGGKRASTNFSKTGSVKASLKKFQKSNLVRFSSENLYNMREQRKYS